MSRVTLPRLVALDAGLSDPERALIRDLAELRLASHAQLAALLSSNSAASVASRARIARRVLARLTDAGILGRLERRVGGIRAGSQGYLYYLGPVGQRLVAYWEGRGLTRGRFRPEPGGRYVHHRLAVSELYVGLRTWERDGELELEEFQGEPASWRHYLDGFGGQVTLKPDAFVRVGVGAYEERWFVEVDLATESRSVVARKLQSYVDYWHAGHEQETDGVFPRVLLLTLKDARREALVTLCSRLPAEAWQLFTVGLLERGPALIAGSLEDDAHAPEPVGGAL